VKQADFSASHLNAVPSKILVREESIENDLETRTLGERDISGKRFDAG
jgi:hypothetical protein